LASGNRVLNYPAIRELWRNRACPGQAQGQAHAQALPQALHASRLTSSHADRTAAPAIELVPDAATSATLASSSLWQLVFAVRNALRHQRHCRAGRCDQCHSGYMRVIHPGVDECVTNRMLSLDSFKEAMKLFTADQVWDVPFALTMAAGGAGPPTGAGRGGR